MSQTIHHKSQSGNVAIIALVALVVVAVGALVYLSGNLASKEPAAPESTPSTAAESVPEGAQVETAAGETETPNADAGLVSGNPVVAKVDGEDITRQEVFALIQNLPPQTRQMPLEQLFPLALDQVINGKVIEEKTQNVNLDNDPEVKKQLALAKKQIEQTVYLQNLVNKEVTDKKIQQSYDKLVAETPKETEVRASHILVDDEKTAKEVVEKLIETGDFAALAKEYSKDPTAEKGGDLGYFLKGDVVKEFGDAAFGMEPGTYTKEPVKSQFGYHVIKVDDKRERQPPTLEQAKPFIEANLRREALEKIVQDWIGKSDIERYDINGNEIAPAAGEETATEPAE